MPISSAQYTWVMLRFTTRKTKSWVILPSLNDSSMAIVSKIKSLARCALVVIGFALNNLTKPLLARPWSFHLSRPLRTNSLSKICSGVPVGNNLSFTDNIGMFTNSQSLTHVVIGNEHADAALFELNNSALWYRLPKSGQPPQKARQAK